MEQKPLKPDALLACKPQNTDLLTRELRERFELRSQTVSEGLVAVHGSLRPPAMPCYCSWALLNPKALPTGTLQSLPALKSRGIHEAAGLCLRIGSDCYGGQRLWHSGSGRMRSADDSPSRAGMKLEEAFLVMGRTPDSHARVADLGAAPGGWSLALAQRGAYVTAIDRGPLKGEAASHRRITHLREDASRFALERGDRYDWMVCDIIDYPSRSHDILLRWLERRWMVHFVVTFKTGRANPIDWLQRLNDPQGRVRRHTSELICQHLWHNRDEFTVMGTTRM